MSHVACRMPHAADFRFPILSCFPVYYTDTTKAYLSRLLALPRLALIRNRPATCKLHLPSCNLPRSPGRYRTRRLSAAANYLAPCFVCTRWTSARQGCSFVVARPALCPAKRRPISTLSTSNDSFAPAPSPIVKATSLCIDGMSTLGSTGWQCDPHWCFTR